MSVPNTYATNSKARDSQLAIKPRRRRRQPVNPSWFLTEQNKDVEREIVALRFRDMNDAHDRIRRQLLSRHETPGTGTV